MEYVNVDDFVFQNSQFYIDQIERLIEVANSNNKVQAWAPPIVSFFSGRIVQSNDEEQPIYTAFHVNALDHAQDKEILRKYFIKNYKNIVYWVAYLYYYFRVVNAYPELASELLKINGLLEVLDKLEESPLISDDNRFFFLNAYAQILPYASGINDDELVEICLQKLNDNYQNLSFDNYSNLMKFRCVITNKGNRSYYEAINFLKKEIITKSFDDNATIINSIYCEDKEFFLRNFKILKKRLVETIDRTKSDQSFRLLIFNLLLDGFLYLVQELYYFLNYRNENFNFLNDHNFILVNTGDFVFFNGVDAVYFENQSNIYKELMNSQNGCLNSYTSLAFDKVYVNKDLDYTRYHVADHNLSEFISNTISCYRVNGIEYSQFKSVTFLPIDTHPVQACIVLNKKELAPLINISFDGKVPSLNNSKLLCFLTKNSQTYDNEFNFISSLDYEKNIFTDPSREEFLHALNSIEYDILYISAHGEYEHFSSYYEEIVFGNEEDGFHRISTDDIERELNTKMGKKNLILNICDGANSGLTYLVANRGVANKFAIKGHVVLSYLWPVEPKYAVVFSSLVLYQLKEKKINQAYFDVLTLLNTTNEEIYEKLVSDENTKIWAEVVLYFSGFISDSHLYSSAIYT